MAPSTRDAGCAVVDTMGTTTASWRRGRSRRRAGSSEARRSRRQRALSSIGSVGNNHGSVGVHSTRSRAPGPFKGWKPGADSAMVTLGRCSAGYFAVGRPSPHPRFISLARHAAARDDGAESAPTSTLPPAETVVVPREKSRACRLEPTCVLGVQIIRKPEHAMGATMPFSKLQLDPDHIEAMHDAFRRVCDILQLSCDREDPLTEIVVLKIMDLAKAGERDPEVLCIDVLAELGAPSQGAAPGSTPAPITSVAVKEAAE
jgi:hypothetical protein